MRCRSCGCELIERIPLDDARVGAALAQHPREEMAAAYRGVRLADLSSYFRGKVIETIVRTFDTT